jgi:hypothetical protein
MVKKNIKKSSETTRETLLKQKGFINVDQQNHLNLNSYIKKGTPMHKPFPEKRFLEWFIGFFEAEGSFTTWFDKKQRFEISITQKDPKLMYKIKKRFGFGNVTSFHRNNTMYWRYQVGKADQLKALILLFNGNLITSKKQKQFKRWVELMNTTYKTRHRVLQNSVIVSLKTGWLSGFLEGDGGFYAKSTDFLYKKKDGTFSYKIPMTFSITQKGETEVLNQIKNVFQIPSDIYTITNGHSIQNDNRLETSVLRCHQKIVHYLTIYPFLGQRNILIKRWGRILDYRIKKYPITEKSIKKLKKLLESTKNSEVNILSLT